jgi:hypothetical protein
MLMQGWATSVVPNPFFCSITAGPIFFDIVYHFSQ